MPATALIIELVKLLVALAPQIPAALEIGATVISLVQTGTVTPEQEVAIRAQIDAVKAQIDAA